jgi:hypothetical protein
LRVKRVSNGHDAAFLRHEHGLYRRDATLQCETPPVTIAPDGTVVAPPATPAVTPGSNTPTK